LAGLIELVSVQPPELAWDLRSLGISNAAFAKVKAAGVAPHMVFCHSELVSARPAAIDYYRNLAALSAKGLAQMVQGLRGQEKKQEVARTINQILSSIVEDMDRFDLALAQAVIPVEIGAELQGSWVNVIGQGAARRVAELITDFAMGNGLAEAADRVAVPGRKRKTETHLRLKNGWRIIFSSEPDVAVRDAKSVLRVAIEIKGSMDRAGAQTRYGEAKKSFGKALAENAQCETIYLCSCFTDAVVSQIRADAHVRKWFNLVDVFADQGKRQEFLDELFKHQIRVI